MRPDNLKVSAFNAMLPTIFTLSITSRENLLEITQGSKDSGIEGLEIYLWGTCMLTIMEVDENFSLEKRAKAMSKIRRCRPGSSLCGVSNKRCQEQSQAENKYAWNVFLS